MAKKDAAVAEPEQHEVQIKPPAFERGVPPEERNGLYALKKALIDDPHSVIVIGRYDTVDIVTKSIKGEQYAFVKLVDIEPLLDQDDAATALKLRDHARELRGKVQLDDPKPVAEPPVDFEQPLTDKPADYVAPEPEAAK